MEGVTEKISNRHVDAGEGGSVPAKLNRDVPEGLVLRAAACPFVVGEFEPPSCELGGTAVVQPAHALTGLQCLRYSVRATVGVVGQCATQVVPALGDVGGEVAGLITGEALVGILPELGVLTVWLVVPFFVALKIFRWS